MASTAPRSGTPSPARAQIGRDVAASLDANPLVGRTPVDTAQIYHYRNFLSRTDCRMLMRLIDANPYPSPLVATSYDPEFRTSFSCDLDRHDPQVRKIDARIATLLGIPFENGEALQGQRYEPGQQFREHCDYFHEDQPYWRQMDACGGQRTWTAMVYLNTVESGGETLFARVGVKFTPTPGLLLIWNNLAPDGSANPYVLHEGVKVEAGTKYVVTKWFRERLWAFGAP